MTDILNRMKILITVLAILLGIGISVLIGMFIYSHAAGTGSSAVSPDNYIKPIDCKLQTSDGILQLDPAPILLCASAPTVHLAGGIPMMPLSKTIITSDRAKETVISIYKNHAEDSTPFNCSNMFPGDSETKTYLIEVSHKGTVTVRFHADIRAGYEKLAEVLKCKVTLHGENTHLYDGLMRDMPESINHRISSVFGKTTKLTYDITIYLDTSVGNAYMNKELIADFRWWVEESGGAPNPPAVTTEPEETIVPIETTTSPETTVPPETTAPVETTIPPETAAPAETTAPPVVTTSSAEPDTPAVTTSPTETTSPKETISPAVTVSPAETTTPHETDERAEPIDPITAAITEELYEPEGELISPPKTSDPLEIITWFWIILFVLLVIFALVQTERQKAAQNRRN